jgi:hypothetical protein
VLHSPAALHDGLPAFAGARDGAALARACDAAGLSAATPDLEARVAALLDDAS